MKIIFLDIDGVLNWGGTEELAPSGCIGVEDMMIRNLKKIVDDTSAKIVLTSTWKSEWSKGADYKSEDFKYLENKLREFNITIFDKTNDHISNRGEGIKKYLHAHSEITNWVVIDDIKFDDFTYFSSQNRNSEVGTDTLLHECTSFQFLSDVIEKKIEQCKENYEIINFHYDKTTFSPELSVLSQIVDDTSSNYQRRMNIFNTKTDSVGINCIKINTHPSLYCIYLVFARSLNSNLDIIP